MAVTTVTHLLYFMYTISLMAKLEVLNFQCLIKTNR